MVWVESCQKKIKVYKTSKAFTMRLEKLLLKMAPISGDTVLPDEIRAEMSKEGFMPKHYNMIGVAYKRIYKNGRFFRNSSLYNQSSSPKSHGRIIHAIERV